MTRPATFRSPIAAGRPPVRLSGPDAQHIAEIAGGVPDPELPMVSLTNLGVLRAVDVDPDSGAITVTITPTYTGCPAMNTMAEDVVINLRAAGYLDVTVRKVLSDTWSSDDLTPKGRQALRDNGIAPPATAATDRTAESAPVACPLCHSLDTEQLSRFGATSCKALYRCRACREPFEYFKVH
ncbi:MAG: phenylacetate-CoA oxygenase subunit PaaJ [Actinobacteria bacterium]|nr:phenylacetate-CoA oxygenase subunit PaaJ [Actinomycetota bacterium]